MPATRVLPLRPFAATALFRHNGASIVPGFAEKPARTSL
jgi:hypothetical protein